MFRTVPTRPLSLPFLSPRLKWVLRWDGGSFLLRVLRIMWERGKPGLPGGGYSAKLSVGIRPALLGFRRERDGWLLTILGLRFHMARSYGGIFALLCIAFLAACTPQANVQPASTPTTNASQQVAATAISGYLAADTAWIAAMRSGQVSRAQVEDIAPKRQAASAALDRFASASNAGDQAAARSAFETAMDAWTRALAGAHIAVQPTKPGS